MEQIKVGDIVRVSEDAPKVFAYSLNPLWFTEECTVVDEICFDHVVIKLDADNHMATGLTIPTRYLIKVGGEEKESKYSKGDKVIFKQTGKVKVITDVVGENRYCITTLDGESPLWVWWHELEPYTEPTPQTDGQEHKSKFGAIKIPIEAEISDTFWIAYETNLAKEIAVKLAGSTNFRDAKEKAAYVVEYAREIVENLKKSEE